jgi:conjugal transfer pilus assembly protein TraE
MKNSLFTSRIAFLLRQRNFSLGISGILLISNVILSCAILLNDTKTILVPPELNRPIWIKNNSVSSSYIEEQAFFFASLFLNVSPEGASHQREIILRHVSSDAHEKVKQFLLSEENRLKKEGLSLSFKPTSIISSKNPMSCILSGILTGFIGERRVINEKKSYCFEFCFKNGFLKILSFEEKE